MLKKRKEKGGKKSREPALNLVKRKANFVGSTSVRMLHGKNVYSLLIGCRLLQFVHHLVDLVVNPVQVRLEERVVLIDLELKHCRNH